MCDSSAAEGDRLVVNLPQQGPIAGLRVPLRRFSDEDAQCRAGASIAYLGIPFAQPPVGPLRWKKPQRPAPSWRESGKVRPSQWRADPIQDLALSHFYAISRRDPGGPSPIDMDGGMDEHVSEDCLYLNVWVPEMAENASHSELPVLAWVYGGAFVTGSASQAMFDGARLAHESQCIVVSLTYRVGVIGFLGSSQLAHNEQDGAAGTGNYGLWDIVAGLEWIQENIAAFGGDPSNVTAFGESAGAIALHGLLVSKATPSNLFARACLESGTALTVAPRTLPSAQATFEAIAAKLGTTAESTDKEKLDLLYKATPRQLLAAVATMSQRRPRTEYIVEENGDRPRRRMDAPDQYAISMESSGLFAPIWDGVMADENFVANAVKGIPEGGFRNAQKGIILGCTADEGTLFSVTMTSPQALASNVNGYHPDIRPRVQHLYGTTGVTDRTSTYYVGAGYSGDNLFITPVMDLMGRLAQNMAADKVATPAYGYIHSHRPSQQQLRGTLPSEDSVKLLGTMGALHMAEINFVFGYDGVHQHSFARSKYPGTESGLSNAESKQGFTAAERHLSLSWMRSLAAFARGEAPWTPVVSQTNKGNIDAKARNTSAFVEDVNVRVFGDMPRLGATSAKAQQANEAADSDAGGVRPIVIRDTIIKETLFWTEPVAPAGLDADAVKGVGSAQQKHALWADDGFKSLLLAYYGDERIRFIPPKGSATTASS